VLESLKVPALKSILLYLTYEKYSGNKEALQDQLLERAKWKEAWRRGWPRGKQARLRLRQSGSPLVGIRRLLQTLARRAQRRGISRRLQRRKRERGEGQGAEAGRPVSVRAAGVTGRPGAEGLARQPHLWRHLEEGGAGAGGGAVAGVGVGPAGFAGGRASERCRRGLRRALPTWRHVSGVGEGVPG